MDASPPTKTAKINRFLPYWAVFQADLKQMLRSWLYRAWVLLSTAAAVGYLMYRYGAKQEAGIIQSAPEMMSNLLSYVVLASVTLIIVLTAGAICSERGTMADSVLSRGISRFQYFMGKWHARIATVLGTFFLMSILSLVAAYFLLHSEQLSLSGCVIALLTVGAILTVVITCGVSVSAVANTTVVSIAVAWMVLHVGAFLLSLAPVTYPAPDRALKNLPNILRGLYDVKGLLELIGWSAAVSVGLAVVGMVHFARRDV